MRRFLQAATGPALVDETARTVELSFSSELPVERWFGLEVLSHAPGCADLSRLNSSAPLLFNHDLDDVLGVVESARIDADGKGRAVVRLGRDDRGEWAMQQIADGILCNVSFAYVVNRYELADDKSRSAYGKDDDDEDEDEDRSSVYYAEDAAYAYSHSADNSSAGGAGGAGSADVYIATSWTGLEISIVTVPADPSVGIGRSYQSKGTHMDHAFESTAAEQQRTSRRQRAAASFAAEDAAHAREDERDRIAGLRALCVKNGAQDLEAQLIADGTTIQQARGIVLGRVLSRNPQGPVASLAADGGAEGFLGLTDREVGSFSLVRAVAAVISGDWSQAGFERACSQAVQRQLGRAPAARAFFVPNDVKQRAPWGLQQTRAPYLVGTAGQGGNLVQTSLMTDQFVDALRNVSQVINAGATMLSGLVGNIDIPRRITTTGTGWVAESGALSESEATFDKISLRPKTLGAWSKMSRLMLLQATPAIEMMARNDLMLQMGLGIDLAALSGSGTGSQPTGVASTSGIGAVVGGPNGLAVTMDQVIQLEAALANSNAPSDSRAYIFNTKTIATLKTQKASTGSYIWTAAANGGRSGTPGDINGYTLLPSNQARSNLTKGSSSGVCSELFFGAWSELIIGQWGVLEIMVNPYDSTGFLNGDVLIRAMQTLDIAVKHAASFATMSDALTP